MMSAAGAMEPASLVERLWGTRNRHRRNYPNGRFTPEAAEGPKLASGHAETSDYEIG
jgi:hypothetical protein